jgi:hypothetical protein
VFRDDLLRHVQPPPVSRQVLRPKLLVQKSGPVIHSSAKVPQILQLFDNVLKVRATLPERVAGGAISGLLAFRSALHASPTVWAPMACTMRCRIGERFLAENSLPKLALRRPIE